LFVVPNNGRGDIKKNISAVESTLPPLRSAPCRVDYRFSDTKVMNYNVPAK